MPEKEVCSPVNTRSPTSHKLSGNIPGSSPGARSNPSRGRTDSIQPQPAHARVSLSSGEEPASLEIIGPSPEE